MSKKTGAWLLVGLVSLSWLITAVVSVTINHSMIPLETAFLLAFVSLCADTIFRWSHAPIRRNRLDEALASHIDCSDLNEHQLARHRVDVLMSHFDRMNHPSNPNVEGERLMLFIGYILILNRDVNEENLAGYLGTITTEIDVFPLLYHAMGSLPAEVDRYGYPGFREYLQESVHRYGPIRKLIFEKVVNETCVKSVRFKIDVRSGHLTYRTSTMRKDGWWEMTDYSSLMKSDEILYKIILDIFLKPNNLEVKVDPSTTPSRD